LRSGVDAAVRSITLGENDEACPMRHCPDGTHELDACLRDLFWSPW
jgi:hypothetical protein